MATATQDTNAVKKPRSEFRVGFREPDSDTGVQHIEIDADLYIRSVADMRDLLDKLAGHLTVDIETGRWRGV